MSASVGTAGSITLARSSSSGVLDAVSISSSAETSIAAAVVFTSVGSLC